MKNLKSFYDLKNLIDLVDGFELGWVAKIQMQTKAGEEVQKLLLNFWKKHYNLMIENHNLKFKLKQAEDAYWQVQKMHDLWVEQDKMKNNEEIVEFCPMKIPEGKFSTDLLVPSANNVRLDNIERHACRMIGKELFIVLHANIKSVDMR